MVDRRSVQWNTKMAEKDKAESCTPKSFDHFYDAGSVDVSYQTVKFEDVYGYNDLKEALNKAAIECLKPSAPLEDSLAKSQSNFLLYGPPGCGKTFLTRAFAGSVGCVLINVHCYSVQSRMVTDSSRFIQAVYECAKANQPCVIVLEDTEVLAKSENVDAKTSLISVMDSLSENKDTSIVVIATSLYPWKLDDSIKKRFKRHLYMGLPDQETRQKSLESECSDNKIQLSAEDVSSFAKMLEGYTFADISCILRDAYMEPIRKLQRATHFRKVQISTHDGDTEQFLICSSDHPDAVETEVTDLDPDKVFVPPVTEVDLYTALKKSKPTVLAAEIQQFELFMKENAGAQ